MKKSFNLLSAFLLIFALFLTLAPVFAKAPVPATADDYGLKTTANAAGVPNTGTLAGKIGSVTGALLSLVGILFFLLALYGGIMWMTAQGDSSRVEKAQGIIIDAVIGLVVVGASYLITSFIFGAI